MEGLFSTSYQIIAGILVLAAVIFFHELGHFVIARKLKLGVVTFSVGFGPKIWKKTIDKTEYCLSAIPLGGYCAIVGEYSPEVEELGFTEDESIVNRPPLDRLLVALAGPLANFIFAFFIYFGVAWYSGANILLPVVGDIAPNSAAAEIGLQKNDIILSINANLIDEWSDVTDIIGKTNGATSELEYERDGKIFVSEFTPKESLRTNLYGEEEKAFLLGISPSGDSKVIPLGLFGALKEGFNQIYQVIYMTLEGLVKLVTGTVSTDNLGGPIYIAQVLGQQATQGFIPLLFFCALINVNLGILNLLPIPALDGGTILFSALEIVTRRRMSENLQNRLMQIGMLLLISLMVFTTWNDIMRFFR